MAPSSRPSPPRARAAAHQSPPLCLIGARTTVVAVIPNPDALSAHGGEEPAVYLSSTLPRSCRPSCLRRARLSASFASRCFQSGRHVLRVPNALAGRAPRLRFCRARLSFQAGRFWRRAIRSAGSCGLRDGSTPPCFSRSSQNYLAASLHSNLPTFLSFPICSRIRHRYAISGALAMKMIALFHTNLSAPRQAPELGSPR